MSVLLSEQAFERAAVQGVLSPVLPYLEEELARLQEQRLSWAFLEIAKGTLSPEKAQSVLIEVKSYRDLLRKLTQRAAQEPEVTRG